MSVTDDCHGEPLLSPVEYYEVSASAQRLDEWREELDGTLTPIYSRFGPYIKTGLATQLVLDLDPGDIVWWDGMWDDAWQIQPPVVEAFTMAGIGSDAPCL
jgi:hypothetical protein